MDEDTKLSRYLYLTDREHINVDSIKQLCKISNPNSCYRCGCTALHEYFYNYRSVNGKYKYRYNGYYQYYSFSDYENYNEYYYDDYDRTGMNSESESDNISIKTEYENEYEFYDETQDQSTQLVGYDIKLKTNEDDFVDEFYGYDRSVGVHDYIDKSINKVVYGRESYVRWRDIWQEHNDGVYSIGKECIDNIYEDRHTVDEFYKIDSVSNVNDAEHISQITNDVSTQTWEKKSELDRYMEMYPRHRYSKHSIFKGFSDKVRKNDLDMNVVKELLSNGASLTIKDSSNKDPIAVYFRRTIMNLEMIDIINKHTTIYERRYIVHSYLKNYRNFDYPFFRKLVLTNKHCLDNYYNTGDRRHGTPLHILATNKKLITPNYMKLLVYNGNDINARGENTQMQTPLHKYLCKFVYHNIEYGIRYYNEKIIDAFIELGADLTIPNDDEMIPVIYCIHVNAEYGYNNITNIRIIRKLLNLSRHAPHNLFRDRVMHDYISNTYIDIECLDIIRSLDGFDINCYFEGRTPLHCAIQYNFTHIAEYLLDRGADISLKTGDGKSVFDLSLCSYIPLKWTSFLISRLPPKSVMSSLTNHIIDYVLTDNKNIIWQSQMINKYVLLLDPSFYSRFRNAIKSKLNQYDYRCFNYNRYRVNKKYRKVLHDIDIYIKDVQVLKSILIANNVTLYDTIVNNTSEFPVRRLNNKQLINTVNSNIYHDLIEKVIKKSLEKCTLTNAVLEYMIASRSQSSYLSRIPNEILLKILYNLSVYDLRKLYARYMLENETDYHIESRSISTQTE
ncbi:ankyrin-like protein [Variola virus]|uniref:Ankyrin-like protein n=1 Tax=Variola virus TaxID=10255 RepID=Q76U54_VARV|nr:homolog of vaccinia virus CDS B20R; putative [Variola major virus]AAA69460.1 B18R [Variola virus]ABF23762.1 ankyrin-like protein [Variola virus]ABF23959.1 ankyrin-like protein [Variola virus]ABF24156.1 ankyrin-like protein [Variola virus]